MSLDTCRATDEIETLAPSQYPAVTIQSQTECLKASLCLLRDFRSVLTPFGASGQQIHEDEHLRFAIHIYGALNQTHMKNSSNYDH